MKQVGTVVTGNPCPSRPTAEMAGLSTHFQPPVAVEFPGRNQGTRQVGWPVPRAQNEPGEGAKH